MARISTKFVLARIGDYMLFLHVARNVKIKITMNDVSKKALMLLVLTPPLISNSILIMNTVRIFSMMPSYNFKAMPLGNMFEGCKPIK